MGDFSRAFAIFAEETKEKIDLIYLGIIFEVGDHLSLHSPVDTGFFRANWNGQFGSADLGVVQVAGATESPAAAKPQPDWTGGLSNRIFYWANGVAYGPALENGHSDNAPNGMLRTLDMEWDDIVARVSGKAA